MIDNLVLVVVVGFTFTAWIVLSVRSAVRVRGDILLSLCWLLLILSKTSFFKTEGTLEESVATTGLDTSAIVRICAAMFSLLVVAHRLLLRKTPIRGWPTAAKWFALFLTIAAIASLFSDYVLWSMFFLLETVVAFLVVAVGSTGGTSRSSLKWFFSVSYYYYATLLVACIAGTILAQKWEERLLVVWPSFGPNPLGIMAALFAIDIFIRLLNGESRWKAAMVAIGILAVAILVATRARGAAVGFAVGMLLISVKHKRALIPIAAIAIALSVYSLVAMEEVETLTREAVYRGGAGDASQVTSGRTDIWRSATDLILDAPIIGHGYHVGNRVGLMTVGAQVSHSHNSFLRVAIDAGILGLLAWLAAVLSINNLNYPRRSQNTEGYSLLERVWVANFVLLVMGFFYSPRVEFGYSMLPLLPALFLFRSHKGTRADQAGIEE